MLARTRLLTLASALVALATSANAQNWPNQRGPHFDGRGTKGQSLPAKISKDENVKWAAPLPGPSAGTPVIWDDKVFLTAAIEESKTLVALCLDRQSGDTLWSKEVAEGFKIDDRSNLANPSPTADAERVIFFFGTGDMAAFDHDGNPLWNFNLLGDDPEHYFAFQWTFSSSPLLYDGKLYMQVLQRDQSFVQNDLQRGKPGANDNESYLAAYDPATGDQLFKVSRSSDAVAESNEAFSMPIPVTLADESTQILVAGGDDLTGHDPQSGEELWRWGTYNPQRIGHWRLVPSPVAGEGVALVCGPKREPIYAIDLESHKVAWKSDDQDLSSDVSIPLFYQGHFYVINSDRRSLACLDPKSGKKLWGERLDAKAKIEASPSAADGKIYFIDHRGGTMVVAANPEKFELLSQSDLSSGENDNEIRSSVSLAGGNVFVRTNDTLFCFGN
ncbi:PQQ-binding-like beta-propeller repeat protein [soil metagenome]